MGLGYTVRKLLTTKLGKKFAFGIFRLASIVEEAFRYEYGIDFYERLNREDFFFKSMRFLKFNHIKGDYLEFGCFGGLTFGLAYKHKRIEELDMRLFGFDSFRGLPKPKGGDIHDQWKEGDFAISMKNFSEKLNQQGANEKEYTLVPGFYEESLKKNPPNSIGLVAASLVYIDCDLYESTVLALNYILPILQTGTIIAFDDFYCFNGDPEKGGQRALSEFLQRNKEIEMVDYLNFGWHGKSFIAKKRAH